MSSNKLKFPHIKYISEIQDKSQSDRTLYYLGGEPEENHIRLTVGKQYVTRTASYSPHSDVERVSVWICSADDDNGSPIEGGKVCMINLNNFGTFADLREKKLKIMQNMIYLLISNNNHNNTNYIFLLLYYYF